MMIAAQSQTNVPLTSTGLVALAVQGTAVCALMAWIETRTTGRARRGQR